MSSIEKAIAAQAAAHERHFVKRVRERFGIKLTAERYRLWIVRAENVGRGVKFLGQSAEPGRTAWLLTVGGVRIRVIYDESTQRLVTALPYGRDEHATLHRRKILRLRAQGRKPDPDWLQKKKRMLTTKTQSHKGQKRPLRPSVPSCLCGEGSKCN